MNERRREGGLPGRFRRHWASRGWTESGDRVAVACSGGLDSVVLLHLLRFAVPEIGVRVRAAHFDHGMRPGSAQDADWVRGLAGAWAVPLHDGRSPRTPATEAEARRLRYAFLEGLVRAREVEWVLTAHQSDDQVETVLFRILRGTGLRGLRGIPESRSPGILRPLLPFERSDLEAYAAANRIRPRPDPTNVSVHFSRNRIRREILPQLEAAHAGARRALLRVARNASRERAAFEALLDLELGRIGVESSGHDIVLDRSVMLRYPAPLLAALVRRSVERLDGNLTEAGTASAVEFISRKPSGARLDLSGSIRLAREFDRIRVSRSASLESQLPRATAEELLVIGAPGTGRGEIQLSGARLELRWEENSDLGRSDPGAGSTEWEWTAFDPEELSFPLRVRAWRPGDRIRIRGRPRKLKRVFQEARIPRSERARLPVFVDAQGLVVWLPGQASGVGGATGKARWRLGVRGLRKRAGP